MGALNNLYVSSSFQGLMKLTNSATGLTNSLQTIQAGDGSDSPLQMSLTQVNISGSFTVNNLPITGSTSGTAGTSGTSGTSGSSGSAGTSGTSGSSGSAGTSGSSGSAGTSGSSGSNGSSGTSGSNGSSGTSGSSGSNGSSGTSGSSGSNGSSGTSGSSGSNGSDGSSGTSGSSGSAGSDGSSGTSGSSGSDGSSGSSGSDGSSGTSGSSGSDGSSGTSGSSGSDGSSGTSGSSGSDGTSGSNGTDGTSGTSGISPSLVGVITTGSIATTQSITGSLILNGDQYISNGVLQVATYPQTTKQWFSPTAIEAIGTASVAYEQYIDGGGYDAFNVVTTLDSGSQFRDLRSDTFALETWLQIPRNTGNNPAPQFKRGLGITGSLNVTGGITGSFNKTGLITTGSLGTTQSITGSLNLNSITTLGTGTTPATPNSSTGTLLIFSFNDINGSANPSIYKIADDGGVGWTMSGSGITNGTVTSAGYGDGVVEVNITSGNVVSGSSYTGTGPYFPYLNVTGSVFSNSGFVTPVGLTVQNADNSGVQYGTNYINCNGADPTNIFSGFIIDGGSPEAKLQLTLSSYTPMYGPSAVPTLYAGGYYNAGLGFGSTDVTMTFYSSSIQMWMPTQFKAPVQITGSLRVTGGITGSLQGTSSFATTASFALNTPPPNRNGLITTGSLSDDQTITGQLRISGSNSQGLQIGAGNSTAKINVFNSINPFLYHNTDNYSTVIGQTEGSNNGFTTGSEKNLLFTGFYLAFNSGSNNTVVAGGGGNFRSGSNNTIISQFGNLQFGNNNTYIGTGGPNALEDDTLRIGAGGNQILLKSGSNALQIGSDTQITGSLLVSNGATITGSLDVKGNTFLSGSLYTNKNIIFSGSNFQTQPSLDVFNNQTFVIQNTGIGSGYEQSGSAIQMTFTTGSGGNASFQMNASVSGSIADLSVLNSAGLTKVRGLSREFLFSKTEGFPNTAADKFEVVATDIILSGNTAITGSLSVSGNVLFASGSNKTIGTVALDGANPGVATVSNSLVTANSLIFLTKQTNNHPNAGPVVVSSKGSGTFTITSNHNGDTDTVAYQIINPI
jgi:hypothetical protein